MRPFRPGLAALTRRRGFSLRSRCNVSGDHPLEAKQTRRLIAVLALTGGFFLVEMCCALVAGSDVLKADALHLGMDVSALGMSLAAMRIATRKPSERFTFGLHRAEPLAASVNAVLVLVGTAVIVHEAIENISAADHPEPRLDLMAAVSLLALVVNGMSAWLLHGAIGHGHHHHHHHHGHGHDEGDAHGKSGDHSLNLRGAWLHVMGDALGATAALGAALAMHLGAPSFIDPIASLVVAAFLLFTATRLLRDASLVLLEGAPASLPTGTVREVVSAVEGVEKIRELHVWSLGAGRNAVVVKLIGKGEGLASKVEKALRKGATLAHVWVHVDADEHASCDHEHGLLDHDHDHEHGHHDHEHEHGHHGHAHHSHAGHAHGAAALNAAREGSEVGPLKAARL